jgi:wyosine [tRNA(Phe)-imidazoG37] synthetase (radical SAM superfamily)
VFIVPGVNDNPDELHAFKKTLTEINPTRVQLNSLDRPGACDWVKVATPESLKKIADFLSPLPVEIISRNSRDIQLNPITAETDEEALYNIIKYRPSTIEEIACSAGMTINNAIALLDKMIQSGKITTGMTNNNTFYKSV